MDNKVMYSLSYGLFVLSARQGDKDNGCITNTAIQVTTDPNRIVIAVNKSNYTHDMVKETGRFTLSILSEEFVSRWPDRIINVHPSLIPAFCGKGMYGLRVHEAALERGVKITGATVHLVNEIPDGGRILLQKAVEVLPDDTPQTLQRRVMKQAEWVLLPQAAEMVCRGLAERETP